MELPSTSTKRARALSVAARVAFCLVDGCNSDLSKCRDYHRRHRVCELHSKTPTVTIRGHERRFCQQCSKFHSLSEFDDGKRSCRKKLDGHNRRRRKPQKPDSLSVTNGNFLSGLQGSEFAPSSMIAVSSLGYCSWPWNVKVGGDSLHYDGPHHQILKFIDQDATTYPGSAFQDSRMHPQYLGVNSTSSESARRSPSTCTNRAITSGHALSLLSWSAAETPVNCCSHPVQPEPSTSVQNHRSTALESTNDAIFHHQGLFRQPNIDGVCSSSRNPQFSFLWE